MARYGITYRGRHSNDIGIVIKTKARPVIAPVRSAEETVPYMDGAVDYSEYGGRLFYDDKLLELEIVVSARSLPELHKKISRVVSWLAGGWDDLIFDDMPFTVWTAKPISIDSIAPELLKVGKTTVQFKCKPFNRLLYSNRGIRLKDRIQIGSNVKLGYGTDSMHELFAGGNTIQYEYIGSAPCAPILRIKAPVGISSLEIALNGCTLVYTKRFTALELNCEAWTAADNGTDVTADITGDYPELLPGTNEITVTADGGGSFEIELYPKYLYGDEGFNE